MPNAQVKNGWLYYEVAGANDAVILISGLGGSAGSWARQVGPLSRSFTVVTYDHRGIGRSSPCGEYQSVSAMADDVVELMDKLGIDNAHIIGHSTGGAIAQTLACTHPVRIKRLVLLSTWVKADSFLRYVFRFRKEILQSLGIAAYLRSVPFFLYPPWWITKNIEQIEQSVDETLSKMPDPHIIAKRIDAILAFDLSEFLPSITAKTLVLCANNDGLTPPYQSQILANLIPNSRLILLDDGGHAAHQTVSDTLNEQLIAFLTENTI